MEGFNVFSAGKSQSKVSKRGKKNEVFSPLDTHTKFIRTQNQKLRFLFDSMRKISGKILASEKEKEKGYSRVSLCGCARIGSNSDKTPVHLYKGENGNYFGGLIKCGSVWRCPVCSYKITQGRGNEIYKICSAWQDKGNYISFITLTLRHKKTDKLKESLNLLLSEFKKMQTTSAYEKLCKDFGIFGFIKTTEITYGKGNGWHPHLHLLFFHYSNDYKRFHKKIISLWINRKNIKALARSQKAKAVYNKQGVSDYITKWDMTKEMVNSNFKTTRIDEKRYTPFSMLKEITEKPKNDVDETLFYLFKEYSEVTKGKHFIVISKNLKAFFREVFLNEMKTDEELLHDEKAEEVLLRVDADLWDDYIKGKNLPSNIITIFENKGIGGVLSYFVDVGLDVLYNEEYNLIIPAYEKIAIFKS